MKNFIIKNILVIIGAILGILGGYLYWKFVGCQNGCPITSFPLNSSIYGGVMGGLLFSIIPKKKNKDKNE